MELAIIGSEAPWLNSKRRLNYHLPGSLVDMVIAVTVFD